MRITSKHIAYGCVLIAIIAGMVAVWPLFGDGIPSNIDQPCHYLRAWCNKNVDSSVPNNWCNYWQAGVPVSQYYYPPIDFLITLMSFVFGLPLAYKSMVVVAMFSQAIGAYVLLRSLGHTLAAGLAFLMLAVQGGSWHFAGFEQIFLVGIWPYVMSTGFWLIGMATFMAFLRHPSRKTVFWAVLPTPFLTHPMTLVFAAISYAFLSIIHYKQLLKHRKLTVWLIALVLLVNAYYIIPFLLKLSLFPRAIGGGMNKDLWVGYIWSKVPALVWLLGIAGLLFMHKQLRWLSGLVIVWILFNFVLPNPFRDYTIGVRFGAFIAPILFMSAAISLERLAKVRLHFGKIVVPLLLVALLIFVPITLKLYARTKDLGKSILLSENEALSPQKSAYEFVSHKKGRVLTEETLYNANGPIAFTHSHCLLPIYANKELVGSGLILFPRNRTIMDIGISSMPKNLFHRPFEDYTRQEVLDILQDYNLKWVIVHTAVWYDYFKQLAVSEQGFKGFVVLEMPINTSWFKAEKIVSEAYDGLSGHATVQLSKQGKVAMKTHYYPNWKATVDGKKAHTFDCQGLLCVDVPSGKHEITFAYNTQTSEWFAYFLSIVGIIILWSKWSSNSASL